MPNKEIMLKLVLLGSSGVGKTSLINQYVHHSFEEDYHSTLGVNIVVKEINLEDSDTLVKLIFWDIAGQEKYDLSRQMFFQGCVGGLFVYDITRPSTLHDIEAKWIPDLKKYGNEKAPYLLIGNKSDLEETRAISIEEGQEFSTKLNALEFIETSAKSGTNVEKAFKNLLLHIIS
ncbi:MAG: GTP-binding protein [Candidatus Lokiarchaeota archaeon]|nr:GTP-binding protein [Candidatus Lokiarchaeota archaeon]